MINYTTPTISLTVEDIDLTGKDVYVTLEQGCNQLTKTGPQLAISIQIVHRDTGGLAEHSSG